MVIPTHILKSLALFPFDKKGIWEYIHELSREGLCEKTVNGLNSAGVFVTDFSRFHLFYTLLGKSVNYMSADTEKHIGNECQSDFGKI